MATVPVLEEGIGVSCPIQLIVYMDPQVLVAVHHVHLSIKDADGVWEGTRLHEIHSSSFQR